MSKPIIICQHIRLGWRHEGYVNSKLRSSSLFSALVLPAVCAGLVWQAAAAAAAAAGVKWAHSLFSVDTQPRWCSELNWPHMGTSRHSEPSTTGESERETGGELSQWVYQTPCSVRPGDACVSCLDVYVFSLLLPARALLLLSWFYQNKETVACWCIRMR